MKILQQVKADRGTASLTFSVRKGKTKATLEVELDSEPELPNSTPSATVPRPRRRRRRRARGAPQQGTPSGTPPPTTPEGEAGQSPRPPRRPLKHLHPAPDGRQVLLHVGRPAEMLSFASFNTDGPPPSLPPRPPPPPPPALQSVSALKLRWRHPNNEVAFNKLPFKDKIDLLSVKGVGVERYRWQHRKPLWPDTPPWHSSPSSSSLVACHQICSSSDSSVGSSYYDSEIDSDECFE